MIGQLHKADKQKGYPRSENDKHVTEFARSDY